MKEDLQFKAAEMMRKVLTVGVGALFLTEESLRKLITDFKLPKELLSAVLESATKTRKDFLRSISNEMMSQVIERIDISALLQELLSKNDIELKMKINFKPKKNSKSSS